MISENQRRTIIEDTIAKIEIGQIVPVIGDDIFYIKDEKGCEVKIHDYVVRRLILRNGIGGTDYKNVYEKARKGFKGMTYLKKVLKDVSLNLKNEILKLYKEENIIQRAYLPNDVYDFLTKREYPLIITTSYSNILEEKLGSKFQSSYYMKERKSGQDIGKINENDEYNRLAEPMVYHILGSISSGYDCALTENDFLQYLHHLHDTNSRPERLLEYINNRRYILALGCNIPDWTLRFLLYSFVTDIGKKDEVTFNGGVIDTKEDENLEEFLLNIDYYYEDVNQKRFITEINRLLPGKERKKIFVSVLSDDLEEPTIGNSIKNDIVNVLKIKYAVWFCDDNLKGLSGEPYWTEIRKGLKECDYFMPIITRDLLDEFEGVDSVEPQPEKERGIIVEWKYALQSWREEHHFRDDFVKPIAMNQNLMKSIKRIFLLENATEGIRQLRQLVYGKELEDGQRTGLQLGYYKDIDKLDL